MYNVAKFPRLPVILVLSKRLCNAMIHISIKFMSMAASCIRISLEYMYPGLRNPKANAINPKTTAPVPRPIASRDWHSRHHLCSTTPPSDEIAGCASSTL